MEALYARARQSVKDKITKYGGTAIISRTSGGGYDDEGNLVPVATTSKKIRAIYRDGSFFNAGSYLAGKASLLLDFTYAPSPQDRVSMGGTDWTVDSVIAVKPDGVTVINYTVVLE